MDFVQPFIQIISYYSIVTISINYKMDFVQPLIQIISYVIRL